MAHVDRSFIVSSPDDKLLRAFVTTGVRVVSALVNGDWIVPLESLFQLPTAQGWLQENWTGVSSPDDKLLRAFVTTGVRVVSALVNGDWIVPLESLFQLPTAQGWLQENWTGFKEAANRVINSLRNIREDVWEKLRNAGLTWGHLENEVAAMVRRSVVRSVHQYSAKTQLDSKEPRDGNSAGGVPCGI